MFPVFLEPPLEPAHEPLRIDGRRAQPRSNMRMAGGRRVEQIVETRGRAGSARATARRPPRATTSASSTRPARFSAAFVRASPTTVMLPRDASGIGGGQQQIADEAPEGEEQPAHRRASGHEVDVARAQRLVHQPAESRPRGDELDDEGPGEQRADRQAVDGADRPQRHAPRVAHDDVARRDAARQRRQRERLVQRLGHRLRLQPLERGRDRQRQRERRQRQVTARRRAAMRTSSSRARPPSSSRPAEAAASSRQ